MKTDYELFRKHPRKYRNEVKSITKLFHLGKEALRGDISPAYFVGKYDKMNHFVIFGINPGYIEEQDYLQEQENKKSWEDYCNHHYKFFKFFQENELKSPYWEKFWLLFSGFRSHNTKEVDWDFLDANVTGLNLIPYHSTKTNTLPITSKIQFGYLKYRLDLNIDFISQYEPKLLIFNGKPWYTLLKVHNLVDIGSKRRPSNIKKDFNLYFFDYKGIPSVLFDKFFSTHWWLTDDDRRNKIPRLILSKYPSLKE